METIAAETRSRPCRISLLFRCRLMSPPDPRQKRASRSRRRPANGAGTMALPADLLDVQRQYARFF